VMHASSSWNHHQMHHLLDRYQDFLEEDISDYHQYVDELKNRERYAIELDFNGWDRDVPNGFLFSFKKSVEKTGLYCGFNQTFYRVIVSPYPSIVRVLCYVAIPMWENTIIRGLLFGYSKQEVNQFIDKIIIEKYGKKVLEEEKNGKLCDF